MSSRNSSIFNQFWNSNLFTNLIALLSLGMSFYVLYKTELNKGKLIVSTPRRVAIASAATEVQGNNSDKILLSFSIYNSGANIKTIRNIYLTITNPNDEDIKLIAEAQFDKLKNINLFKSPLDKNENYSLITAISIPPRSDRFLILLLLFDEIPINSR